jgi:hypothetical protein
MTLAWSKATASRRTPKVLVAEFWGVRVLHHDTALVQAIDLKKTRRDGLAGGAQDAKQSAKRSAGAATSPEQQGVARVPAAVVDVYCFPRLAVAGSFEEEPDAALALVDPVFEQAGAGYVVVFGG